MFTLVLIDLGPVAQLPRPVAACVVAIALEVVAPPRLWERPAGAAPIAIAGHKLRAFQRARRRNRPPRPRGDRRGSC
eukprot:7697089-Pyramimonas_sp.AAC.1